MNKKIKTCIDKIRLYILKNFFTDNEKYLLIRAVEDRITNLEKISINERWANKEDIVKDCMEYTKLKTIFVTKDYK